MSYSHSSYPLPVTAGVNAVNGEILGFLKLQGFG